MSELLPDENIRIYTLDDLIPTVVRKPKKAKAPYKKPDSLKKLQADYQKWWYTGKEHNFPPEHQVKSKFSDDSANNLTKAIVAWLRCNGHYGARINTTGTYSVAQKRFIRSGATKGVGDIDATLKMGTEFSLNVKIEVKFKKDTIRESQVKYKNDIEAANGIYIIVRTFDDFLFQINVIIENFLKKIS